MGGGAGTHRRQKSTSHHGGHKDTLSRSGGLFVFEALVLLGYRNLLTFHSGSFWFSLGPNDPDPHPPPNGGDVDLNHVMDKSGAEGLIHSQTVGFILGGEKKINVTIITLLKKIIIRSFDTNLFIWKKCVFSFGMNTTFGTD